MFQAFLAAWKAACNSNGASTLSVPPGTFFISEVVFFCPCKTTIISVDVRGTLKAPKDYHTFSKPSWILFQDVNALTLTGANSGIIDGQGQQSWASHGGCLERGTLPRFPLYGTKELGWLTNMFLDSVNGLQTSLLKKRSNRDALVWLVGLFMWIKQQQKRELGYFAKRHGGYRLSGEDPEQIWVESKKFNVGFGKQ
ncbi:hypothetical protein IFM89_016865 [Coptis chinensis]|uniref:Polygalacturonase n=1 Tax=Coptis chinensis TaxID=261450 RepID=A0A835GZB6_9MAGN|nr:hypothetical protein IFM89_016865 [Coptis chinensis]